jgi:hypothetical protein
MKTKSVLILPELGFYGFLFLKICRIQVQTKSLYFEHIP